MGIIRALSREVVEKIAAGEVVERPASVVKELVENAVDAGARAITVDVQGGGRAHIAVIDDGAGMDAADLSVCVHRHATSKISSEADLWSVRTMGFRGEALAAIGAVSRLTIETRVNRPEVVEGARLEVEGGAARGPVVAGCPGGTKVVVADLFYNVPARQKFLRSAGVEYGHIHSVVTECSLAFPEVRFELAADGKRRYVSAGGDLRGRVCDILGDDIAQRLVAVEESGDGIGLTGWVAAGGRSGAKDVSFFLNQRPIRDKLLMHALTAAFGERLCRGEYPAAVLMLAIDPSRVDVNVHPAKREVRFVSGGAVHDFVMAAVRKAIGSGGPMLVTRGSAVDGVRGGVAAALERFEQSRLTFKPETRDPRPEMQSREIEDRRSKIEGSDSRSTIYESRVTSHESRFFGLGSDLRVLGQLGATYIVCEGGDGALVLIDQHAAHERLGFDRLKRGYAQGFVPQQVLLVPQQVELGPKERACVMEYLDVLATSGFEIEPFGGGTLLVKAVPEVFGDASVAPLFAALAEELEALETSHAVDVVLERIFATVACHAQVRAGDRLSPEELEALVRDVEREGVVCCPHGRPAVARIERREIGRWFRRA